MGGRDGRHPTGRLAARVAALEAALAAATGELTRLRRTVEELRAGAAAPAGGPATDNDRREGSRFAALYPAFEDRFRGSEAEITRRQRAYLPDARRVVGARGLVDIGPGRGEWLALLAEAGIRAYGVESHPEFVARCRAKGLTVVAGDGVAHLRALPAGSRDMVTAFHVIEHLDVEEALALFEAARHALRPGGCLLVETPNPTNIVMGACDFYCDPTHRAPWPPPLTEYLMSASGFTGLEVRPLHPRQPAEQPAGHGEEPPGGLASAVRERLYGPQDYAVLGFRADDAQDGGAA